MFFKLVFLKMHTKKVIDHLKHHFGHFWRLITVFCAFLKILFKITFKAKTKEKYEEHFFNGFYFKTQKCPFLGVNHGLQFVSLNFVHSVRKI